MSICQAPRGLDDCGCVSSVEVVCLTLWGICIIAGFFNVEGHVTGGSIEMVLPLP